MISASMNRVGVPDRADRAGPDPGPLCLARFLLGAAEGGFFPGVIVYLSHWFSREDRGKATSNFMGAIPLSSVRGCLLILLFVRRLALAVALCGGVALRFGVRHVHILRAGIDRVIFA